MRKPFLIILVVIATALAATSGFLAFELKSAKGHIQQLQVERSNAIARLAICESERTEQGLVQEALETELEECQANIEEFKNYLNNQSSQNWYLQNDNQDLEQRVQDLEDEFDN